MVSSMLALCAGVALMADPQAVAKAPAARPATGKVQAHTVNKPVTQPDNKPVMEPVSYKYFPIELEIVEKTNAERVRHGLPKLELDPKLVETARKHTWWMTRNNTLQHGHYPVAENIAMGQQNSAEVVRSWMNSSGHRANMLNRGHRRIGVAAYTTPGGAIYWCQQFTR